MHWLKTGLLKLTYLQSSHDTNFTEWNQFNKNLETYGNFASNKGGNDNSFFFYAEFKVCVMTNSAPPLFRIEY